MADGGYSLVFGRSHQLLQDKFFNPSAPSIRKGRNREEKKGKRVWKIMMFIVATIVVASQPPERGPTGTPTAHANYHCNLFIGIRTIFA